MHEPLDTRDAEGRRRTVVVGVVVDVVVVVSVKTFQIDDALGQMMGAIIGCEAGE